MHVRMMNLGKQLHKRTLNKSAVKQLLSATLNFVPISLLHALVTDVVQMDINSPKLKVSCLAKMIAMKAIEFNVECRAP